LTWAFAFYACAADIPNGGISNFFSQLIVSFGYTPEQSLLYGTPGGAVEVVSLSSVVILVTATAIES
jgi:ACS family allantoate permease-like MFS transporter